GNRGRDSPRAHFPVLQRCRLSARAAARGTPRGCRRAQRLTRRTAVAAVLSLRVARRSLQRADCLTPAPARLRDGARAHPAHHPARSEFAVSSVISMPPAASELAGHVDALL